MVAVRYNAESDEISMSNSHLQNDLAERSFGCLRIKSCWFALPKRKLIGMIIHDGSCSRAGTSTSSLSSISKIHLTVLRLLFIPHVISEMFAPQFGPQAMDENQDVRNDYKDGDDGLKENNRLSIISERSFFSTFCKHFNNCFCDLQYIKCL